MSGGRDEDSEGAREGESDGDGTMLSSSHACPQLELAALALAV